MFIFLTRIHYSYIFIYKYLFILIIVVVICWIFSVQSCWIVIIIGEILNSEFTLLGCLTRITTHDLIFLILKSNLSHIHTYIYTYIHTYINPYIHAYIDIYIYIYKVHKNLGKHVLSFKPLKPHGFKTFLDFSVTLKFQTRKLLYINLIPLKSYLKHNAAIPILT